MSRVSNARLLRLAVELSGQERELVETVEMLRLVSHAQLSALMASEDSAATAASTARQARRQLQRLTEAGVLSRLGRRVGGVRAGSSGFVYYLGPVGQRLVAYWQGHGLTRGRSRPDPGAHYVRHRLAVSELYVTVRMAERAGGLDLLAFEAEPDCWRNAMDPCGAGWVLKPDAYLRVGDGAYEERCFVEVDLGSESRTVVARKLRAYLDYWTCGQEQADHGVFPRVLLLTNSEKRRAALVDVCTRLPAESWQLFTVGLLPNALALLAGQIDGGVGAAA